MSKNRELSKLFGEFHERNSLINIFVNRAILWHSKSSLGLAVGFSTPSRVI